MADPGFPRQGRGEGGRQSQSGLRQPISLDILSRKLHEIEKKWTESKALGSANALVLSQGLLGLCCSIETRDRIERITLTAVLFN